jgi:hypothetical protein
LPDPRAFQALRELGVGWVRVNFRLGERTADARPILREGYGFWLTLSHRDRSNIADPAAFARTERGGFPPADPARYQDQIRRIVRPLVDELRAQGRNPGDWLVIQVENEVLPRDVAPPDRPNRFWHGTAQEYLRTLALGYDATKSIDAAIPVAAMGFSSEMLQEFVTRRHPPVVAWGERLLREGRFDWLDLHLYHLIEEIPAKVAWVRSRWNGPIAGTEIGGPDSASGARYSESLHAEDVRLRIRAALDAGVRRVFWGPLVEPPQVEPRFVPMSLIVRSDYRRKPAFEAYRRLISADPAPAR